MIRATLSECINLFNSNKIMKRAAIRGMEQLSEWGVAAAYWNKIGDKNNADACKYLQKAIAIGDCYREECKELNEWVDNAVRGGILTREEAIKVIYPTMSKIYDKYYNRGL